MLKIFILSLLFSLSAFANFLPENNLLIAEENNLSQMSKDEFNTIIKKLKSSYKGEALKRGGILSLKGAWKSKQVNAFALRAGPLWKITIHGGLARHPLMTRDGLALVICHELGHHFGGAPKSTVPLKKWNSYEGQADYWAALKCLKRLFQDDDNTTIVQGLSVPELAKTSCQKEFNTSKDQALCMRVVMAGLDMSKLVADYRREAIPMVETPDPKIVQTTSFQHANAQCRLDTYFQAALCSLDPKENVSDEDPIVGVCSRVMQGEVGSRPLCWYAP